jgi:hypothetical protein
MRNANRIYPLKGVCCAFLINTRIQLNPSPLGRLERGVLVSIARGRVCALEGRSSGAAPGWLHLWGDHDQGVWEAYARACERIGVHAENTGHDLRKACMRQPVAWYVCMHCESVVHPVDLTRIGGKQRESDELTPCETGGARVFSPLLVSSPLCQLRAPSTLRTPSLPPKIWDPNRVVEGGGVRRGTPGYATPHPP